MVDQRGEEDEKSKRGRDIKSSKDKECHWINKIYLGVGYSSCFKTNVYYYIIYWC